MNINIISPINKLGYGVAGLNIVKSLAHTQNIALWPIGQIEVTNQTDYNCVVTCMKNAQLPSFDAPCIRIWHQHDMSQFVGRGIKIGFPFFELDKFNNIEQAHLNQLDRIFVCSEWAKQIVISNTTHSNDTVCVVPLGVDIDIFQPSVTMSGPTIFFNCGKWEIRKGHDILPYIFSQAFTPSDDVELWMMCDNPFLSQEEQIAWQNMYKNTTLGHKIRFINRQNTHEEVYNIMSQVDCGVFPARAEGWNLEILELLSCGKNIITTNYSGHTEFCNHTNCYMADISQYEPAYDGKWFHGNGGNWGKIDSNVISYFVESMREIHQQKRLDKLEANKNGIQTAHKFTWTNTAQSILRYV